MSEFMRMAMDCAQSAFDIGEVPVGCVFVRYSDGLVIGTGRNRTNETRNATRHAEFEAIDDILTRYPASIFKQCDLYVTVEPCIMCAAALRELGIHKCFFGCANEKFGGCGTVLSVHKDSYPHFAEFDTSCGEFRSEAINLLRRFYIQENDRAPVPQKKASRLLKIDVPPPSMT